MKKSPVVFLILALVIAHIAAFAVEIDFSNYTDEEMLEIEQLVAQELSERNIQKHATMIEGIYTVGEDIPAGKYTFSLEDKGSSVMPSIWVYKDDGKHTVGNTVSSKLFEDVGDSKIIPLEDGNVIYLDCTVRVTPFKGITFE